MLTRITLPCPRRAKQRKRGRALLKSANLYRSLTLTGFGRASVRPNARASATSRLRYEAQSIPRISNRCQNRRLPVSQTSAIPILEAQEVLPVTEFAELLKSIGALLWPALVFWALQAFRNDIAGAIGRIKKAKIAVSALS